MRVVQEEGDILIWLQVVLMAAAVSFDSLAIGVSYGVAEVNIPLKARLILALISSTVLGGAMAAGHVLQKWLPGSATNLLGGVILIGLGAYTLWRANSPAQVSQIMNLRVPGLGLIIQVFREPLRADLNNDQVISIHESVLLGVTLAFDSLAAGIGAAILGLPVLGTCTAVVIASYAFISVGLHQGSRLSSHKVINSKIHSLPGYVIMLVGLLRILI